MEQEEIKMAEEKKNPTEEEIEDNEDVKDQTDDKNGSGKSGDDKPGEADDKGSKGKSGDKTFTQDQVNRMMTREKNQGRNAVYKELGIDPKDTKAIAMVKALIDSQKTDEQKAAEKESENQTKMNEAEHRARLQKQKLKP